MARKSLISPGSLLPTTPNGPEAGTGGLVEKIVERDRTRSGRKSPEEAAEAASVASSENITSKQESNITAHIATQKYDNITNSVSDAPDVESSSPSDDERRQEARQMAREMASGPGIPITLRMPEALNDFLDECAHVHRKSGVKKQDVIALAIQLLVVELELGVNLLDLIGSDENEEGSRTGRRPRGRPPGRAS